jgi:hypothetical protein
MSIIDQQLVDIEIVTNSGGMRSELQLNYQGQIYQLCQVFAIPYLDSLAMILRDKASQKWQQLTSAFGDRYLLVREVGYYSLWELDRASTVVSKVVLATPIDLDLQQASIWLFQELWGQLADSIGTRQLQLSADNLLTVVPQVKSWVDLDRLLTLDPLTSSKLGSWTEADFATFDRQLYQLTQRKLGHKFGKEITLDIIQTMPAQLQSILNSILDIK